MSPADLREHPDYRAFVAAMFANPDDDTTRLVFADWLQERGLESKALALRQHRPIDWNRLFKDFSVAILPAVEGLAVAMRTMAEAMAPALEAIAAGIVAGEHEPT